MTLPLAVWLCVSNLGRDLAKEFRHQLKGGISLAIASKHAADSLRMTACPSFQLV